ncbi:MAG: YkgJ family cysteine cluster protein [Nitrospirota bacterium]
MKMEELPTKQQLCISCRKCCNSVGIFIDPETYEAPKKDLVNFYQQRGFDVYRSGKLLLLILTDFPCPNLTTKGCKIYKKRPNICRDYSGIEDFGRQCLWSKLPEHKAELKRKKRKKGTNKK